MVGVVTIALLGWSASVRAEPMTLGQVYVMAVQRSEDLQIRSEGVRQAEQEERRALSTVLPKLTLSGDYTLTPEEIGVAGSTILLQPHSSYGWQARVEQPLYSGGKNRAGQRIAQRQVEAAGKDVRLGREALLLRVANVFYSVLRAQKNAEIQTRNVERLKEHRRLAELRYKVGEVTESILLRAEAELASAKAELVSRERDVAVAKRELALLTGLPVDMEIAEPAVPDVPEESMAQWLDAAKTNRDEVERSRLDERVAEERVSFARGNFKPSLALEGTYYRRKQDPKPNFFIEDSWMVAATIDFPLFEGGLRKAELRQAKSRLEQSRLQSARLNKDIDLEVTRAGLGLEAVTRALESRQEQLRFSKKNYEMVSKQFTFGLATNLDVLDANQTLIEAERDVTGATYDRHLAILEVQRSVGRFLSEAEEAMPAEEPTSKETM
ncbi:MAG: TolC family protein [Nitrospirota bacterium]